ncbi:MAG: hypothetical protein K5866_06040 [Treponema sp.]|nr:hypothetical protein [Treponema sp.]
MLLLKYGDVMFKVLSKKIIKNSIYTKLFLSIFSTSLIFCFLSCKNFLAGSDIENKLEEEIKYANAESITVTVSPESMLYGHVTTGSPVTVKIGYPFVVNFAVDEAYNFSGWKAYSNFKSLADKPLPSEYVEFSDEEGKGPGKSLKCSVTIKQKIENLILIPVCASKPSVLLTEPLTSDKNISMTTPIKITFNKKMDLQSILNTDSDGKIKGFKNFKVTYSKSDDEGGADLTGDITDYFDAEKTTLKKNGTQIVIPFKNKTDTSKWLPAASYIFVELGANIASDYTEGSAILDNPYNWTFSTGSNGDVQGPVITSSSLAVKNQSQEKILETVNFKDWQDYQNNRFSSDYDSFKVSIVANDDLRGDSGILRYEVIQRLMYADKGAKLPNGTVLTAATQFFNKNGEWNDVIGCSKNDFEVATEIDGDESGVENQIIELDELFTNYSTDGIYQITLTAVDALENYSDVPATFYFVRDTTAPSLKTNESNIAVSGGLLITQGTVNGLYAKTGKEEITFKTAKTIVDEGLFSVNGNSLQTASKTVDWKISFSTSSTEDTHSISSDYCNANSDTGLTLPIPDLNTTQTYYPWFYFRDDLGNESAGECLSSQPVYVDVTAPVITIACESETAVISDEGDAVSIYTDVEQRIKIEISDSLSGVAYKSVTVDDVAADWNDEFTVDINKTYVFTVSDNAGNLRDKTLYVKSKTMYSPVIYGLEVWDTSEGYVSAPETLTLNSSYNLQNQYTPTSTFTFENFNGLTNGDITFAFYAKSSSSDSNAYFGENGIVFDNSIKVLSYTVYEATEENSEYTRTDSVLLNDNNSSSSTKNYLDIPKNTIQGVIYCEVQCKMDKEKFKQCDYSDRIASANLLNLTVSNNLCSSSATTSICLDTLPPTPKDYFRGTTKIIYKAHEGEENAYDITIVLEDNFNHYYDPLPFASIESAINCNNELEGTGYANGYDTIYYYVHCITANGNNGNQYSYRKYYDSGYNYKCIQRACNGDQYKIYDILGNYSTLYITVITDEAGPEIKVSDNAKKNENGNYYARNLTNDPVYVSFKDFADEDGTNNGIGFSKCKYEKDSVSYWVYDDTIELNTKGTYDFTAYDLIGNQKTATIVLDEDSTAPEIEIVSIVPYRITLCSAGTSTVIDKYGISDGNTQLSTLGELYQKNANLRVTDGVNTNWASGTASIIFKITETGCGIKENGITLTGESFNIIPGGVVGGTLTNAAKWAYTAASLTDQGLTITVTDQLGNVGRKTVTNSEYPVDGEKPRVKKLESKDTTNIKVACTNNNDYSAFKVYMRKGSNLTQAKIALTFEDLESGLNPKWISAYSSNNSINYYSNAQTCARLSSPYTNGSTLTLDGSANGTVYYFSAQDKCGNFVIITVTVYTENYYYYSTSYPYAPIVWNHP